MTTEAERLESMWSGEFGNAYVQRNAQASVGRDAFFQMLFERIRPENVLEVGCNLGGNLRWIADHVAPRAVFGLDVNEQALTALRGSLPSVNAVWGSARDLPFRDQFFELVMTAGVLIHQPPESLDRVMSEMVRVSKRYVLAMEYFAENEEEVPYRGERGALFRRDYGRLFANAHPLTLVTTGDLQKDQGWDDVRYWLFERSGA